MNSGNIKNITNQAIEQLIEALKAGKSEALTNYLAAVAKFHRYSFQNILLIARQCPQATRVAGFHAWRSLDRFVKKGEKGLMILAPLVRKVESADACSTEKESRICGFRTVYVFDVSQTDGAPLPTIGVAQGEPGEYFSRLEQLVREQGISLEYSAEIAPAKGMSCGKKIILLPGMAPAEQFSTLVHELAHEMLHRDARRSENAVEPAQHGHGEHDAFVLRRSIGSAKKVRDLPNQICVFLVVAHELTRKISRSYRPAIVCGSPVPMESLSVLVAKRSLRTSRWQDDLRLSSVCCPLFLGHGFGIIPAPGSFTASAFPVPPFKPFGSLPECSRSPWEQYPLALECPKKKGQKRRNNMYLNSIQIIGFVGLDPERRQVKGNGASYTVLSVATQRSWKDTQDEWHSKTEWHRVVAWNGVGERVAASLRQGDHVLVEGTLVSSSFEREVRKGKKNATVKQISWSIRADAVRKLNRRDKEPEAIASGSTHDAVHELQEHAESAPF